VASSLWQARINDAHNSIKTTYNEVSVLNHHHCSYDICYVDCSEYQGCRRNPEVEVSYIGQYCVWLQGDTLKVGEEIHSGESICARIGSDDDKEWTYFGLREYDMDESGYTIYRAEMWSENGTHDLRLTGIGTRGGDAHSFAIEVMGTL
jgi:hypothetical protein